MLEKEEGWLQEEKPPGRSLLDGGGAGPTDRAEPLPSHGHTEASLHDETRNHSTATEERRGEERRIYLLVDYTVTTKYPL